MPSIDWQQTWLVWEPWVRALLSGLAAGVVIAIVNNKWQDARDSKRSSADAIVAARSTEQRAKDLTRALLAEIDENIQRAGVPVENRIVSRPVARTAWDAARALELPDTVFDAVAAAYVAGDKLNHALEQSQLDSMRPDRDGGLAMMNSFWTHGQVVSSGRAAYDALRLARARLRGDPDPEPTREPAPPGTTE